MATNSKIILQTLKGWVIGFDFDHGIKSQPASTPKNDRFPNHSVNYLITLMKTAHSLSQSTIKQLNRVVLTYKLFIQLNQGLASAVTLITSV